MLRTAMVGLSEVSQWHEAAIANTSGATLVAVADPDESALDRVRSDSTVGVYAGLNVLLEHEPVDWVHVCTPVETHYDLAATCADHGVHVLVEKPFVRTRPEFEALTAAADCAGVRATVVHNQVYYRPFREACRRVRDGEFGPLHGVSVRWAEDADPRDPDRGDWVLDLPGGEFGEGIVHPIYVGLRAAGSPVDESGVDVERIATTTDAAFDGVALSYATADDVACAVKHHSNVPDQRRADFVAEAGHVTVDIATQSVRTHRSSYGPNTPYTYPMVRAALRGVRNATRAMVRAVAETAADRLRDARATHDTHTPVVRREAAAIRGEGEGSTPRAEADWANRLFTLVCGR